jgi:signal peptidase I
VGNPVRARAKLAAILAIGACAVAAITTILALIFLRAYVMPTGSMENTLLVGDHLLALRTFSPTATRGDLIVFRYPVDERQVFIKRVAGVPGDRVRLVKGGLLVNGSAVSEPYVRHLAREPYEYRDNFPSEPNTFVYPSALEMLEKNVKNGEVVVPPGNYFVLGDNRDNSLDSRYWGFVPASNLIGRAVLIYYSAEANGRARGGRAFTLVH